MSRSARMRVMLAAPDVAASAKGTLEHINFVSLRTTVPRGTASIRALRQAKTSAPLRCWRPGAEWELAVANRISIFVFAHVMLITSVVVIGTFGA